MLGLVDTALPPEQRDAVQEVLTRYEQQDGINTHALRTRRAGARGFVSVHVIVPGSWTVHKGHELLEKLERDIREAVRGVTVFTHLESLEDPALWDDTELVRGDDATSAGA